MPLAGLKLEPELIAEKLHALGFRDMDLVEMTATILSESWGWTRAYNDNKDAKGRTISRDCGLGQINIPARLIGTRAEEKLYDPDYNLKQVVRLFRTRRTLRLRRRLQPWYGFTTGWAIFPEWWVYTKALPHHWVPTGRYIHIALTGVANFYAKHYRLKPQPFFPIPAPPPMPTRAPQDGVGPRPKPNDGQGSLGR